MGTCESIENTCSRAGDDQPDDGSQTCHRHGMNRPKQSLLDLQTDSDYWSDDINRDDYSEEMSPSDIRVIAKFKKFVISGAQDEAMRLIDKNHYVDLYQTDFGTGESCMHIAARNGMTKLLLFLLEEGHPVKLY